VNCAYCYFDRPPDGATKTAWFVINGNSTCEAHIVVAKHHRPMAMDPNDQQMLGPTIPSIWKEHADGSEEAHS
jgi:hypothetical protein